VGKSYLLFQLMDKLSALDPEVQQIYINKEVYEFADIRNVEDLLAYIAARRSPDSRLSLFIDELQDIDRFEVALHTTW